MRIYVVFLVAFFVLTPVFAHGADGGAVRVVASIKPVHALVAGVMAGAGRPTLLMQGASSPHAYAMRPSEMRAINEADLVFWIGASMEGFLVKPLGQAGKARSVPLLRAPGVEILPAREGGEWEAHDHDHDHDHDHAHSDAEKERGDERVDPHIWLDPRNAAAMVRSIRDVLNEADPENQALYDANTRALLSRLEALENEIAARLAPLGRRSFIVYHDAYQYFERRFGLNAAGAITVSPDRAAGAKRLSALAAKIGKLGAVCIFVEPQFTPRLAESLARESGSRVAMLDPLGATMDAGPELYFGVLQGLADQLSGCLSHGE
ncbi:MAG: zinc ABC transporter substrate-binding protein [Rhodospirillales bacterium]|nr:zinc ABC transporter substrate-binding protein [Rhodospirillales bacterium]